MNIVNELSLQFTHTHCNVYSHFPNNHNEFIKTLTKLYTLFLWLLANIPVLYMQ